MSGARYSPWGSLTPTYGLGSYSRTSAAILAGQPRSRIGNQNRIYYWWRKRGLGEAYVKRLILSLGPVPTYTYRTRRLI